MAFLKQFPFGRGGLDEVRETHVGPEKAIEHYLRLSTKAFQDWEFILHMYSRQCKMQLLQQASRQVNMKANEKHLGEIWAGLTTAQLQQGAKYSEKCIRASKKGLPRPAPPAVIVDLLL
jgi:hypothetical protein